jgi:hypothetical protein
MIKKLLLISLLIASISAFGQREVIDSTLTDLRIIEKMPPSLEKDTLSSKKFKRLMYHYTFINTDSALYYTKELLAIAERRHIETLGICTVWKEIILWQPKIIIKHWAWQ